MSKKKRVGITWGQSLMKLRKPLKTTEELATLRSSFTTATSQHTIQQLGHTKTIG